MHGVLFNFFCKTQNVQTFMLHAFGELIAEFTNLKWNKIDEKKNQIQTCNSRTRAL